MSIKHSVEIKELRARIEKLEGNQNELGLEHRTVAGVSDPDKEQKPKKKNAKVEGSK